MEARHKVQKVKAYLNAMQIPKDTLHDAVKEEGCRCRRQVMNGSSRAINPACVRPHRAQQSKGLGKKIPVEFKPCYKTVVREPSYTEG